ncbi:MAG TPA: hypothetical protein VF884_12530 [Nitrososphaeraceae archaeon]
MQTKNIAKTNDDSNCNSTHTGIVKDVFKVIVSVFGVIKEMGDIVAAVTVNGNSKVRPFENDMSTSMLASVSMAESILLVIVKCILNIDTIQII